MLFHCRHVQLHQVLEQLNPKVDFAFVSSVERKEVEAVDEIGEAVEGLNRLIFGEDTHKDPGEQEEIPDWGEVRSESNQHLSNFSDVRLHFKVSVFGHLFLPFLDIFDDNWR